MVKTLRYLTLVINYFKTECNTWFESVWSASVNVDVQLCGSEMSTFLSTFIVVCGNIQCNANVSLRQPGCVATVRTSHPPHAITVGQNIQSAIEWCVWIVLFCSSASPQNVVCLQGHGSSSVGTFDASVTRTDIDILTISSKLTSRHLLYCQDAVTLSHYWLLVMFANSFHCCTHCKLYV